MDSKSLADRVWQPIAPAQRWIWPEFSMLSSGDTPHTVPHGLERAACGPVAEHLGAALEERVELLGALSLALFPAWDRLCWSGPTGCACKASTNGCCLASGHSRGDCGHRLLTFHGHTAVDRSQFL